jgi:Flp pilus assembly protein CpaB
MRWLMIVLLVSLVALLVAAGGVARHIWLQRAKSGPQSSVDAGPILESVEEADLEPEP